MQPKEWLDYAREIYTLSQAGLAYSQIEFDLARYKRLQEISAEIIAGNSHLSSAEVASSFGLQNGYPTPKVDVRGAVFLDGKILLVKELADGRWSMPGGWADIGDSPAEMVAREVNEESGFEVRVDKLVAVYNNNSARPPLEFYHAYKLIFLCSITGGSLCSSYETPEVGFFELSALPELSRFRTDERMLAEVQAHLADTTRQTYFE